MLRQGASEPVALTGRGGRPMEEAWRLDGAWTALDALEWVLVSASGAALSSHVCAAAELSSPAEHVLLGTAGASLIVASAARALQNKNLNSATLLSPG